MSCPVIMSSFLDLRKCLCALGSFPSKPSMNHYCLIAAKSERITVLCWEVTLNAKLIDVDLKT